MANIPSPSEFLKKINEQRKKKVEVGRDTILDKAQHSEFISQELVREYTSDIIGGKSVGLGKLLSLQEKVSSINIPNFFVLPTDYFEVIKEELNLLELANVNKKKLEANKDLDLYNIESLSASLTPSITSNVLEYAANKIFEEVKTRGWKTVILRSSCNLEDSKTMPFAGVFNSILVNDLTERTISSALEKVFISAYTVKSEMYCKFYKKDLSDIKMAVIIQEVPCNAVENGSVFVNGEIATLEYGMGTCTESIDSSLTVDLNNLSGSEHISLSISKEIKNLGEDNFTIEFVKTDKDIFIVQIRTIPSGNTAEHDPYENNCSFKKVFEGKTNSINFGNAKGLGVSLNNNDLNNLQNDIIVMADFNYLLKKIERNEVNINNPLIRGFIVFYDNMFFHLSLLAKELIDAPLAFVQKDLKEELDGKSIAINIGAKTRIYEIKGGK